MKKTAFFRSIKHYGQLTIFDKNQEENGRKMLIMGPQSASLNNIRRNYILTWILFTGFSNFIEILGTILFKNSLLDYYFIYYISVAEYPTI